jgi:two-component system nitrogen regulation sensor histidine kinase NtrY
MSGRARARRLSLTGRWSLLVGALLAVCIALTLLLERVLPGRPLAAAALCLACVAPFALILIRAQLHPVLALLRALEGTVASYRDGDFSSSLHWRRNDELADLVAAHNDLGEVLRAQRLSLVQRELLLDTMVQNTPVAMLLVAEPGGTIVYGNLAARQLLLDGWRAAATACSRPATARTRKSGTWRGASSA